MRTNQSLRIASLVALAFAMVASACTKSKELKSTVDPDAYFAKAAVDGKTFHFSRGIEEADSDNNVGATPGMSNDFGLVHARVTETELQFLSAFDTMGRAQTMRIVASYPITSQFDVNRDKNDFGDQTNKVIEDKTKPWQARAFMRVDWAHPSNSLSNFAKGLASEKANADGGDGSSAPTLTEENVTLVEDPKIEKGHISFLVETSVKTSQTIKYVWPMSIETPASYRVVYRTHLLELKPSDYKAIPYTASDFDRFGYFFTQQNFSNPRGLLDKNVHLYANTHNVCEAGQAGSCSTNKIRWVLSKNFPEKYKVTARRVVGEWNKTFQTALNRQNEDVVYLDESTEADMSDPSQNVLAYYPSRTKSGLLGVAQWVSDPRSGELIGVRATVYGDGIDYEVATVDSLIDILANENESDALGVPSTGAPEDYNSPFANANGAKSLFEKMDLEQKKLGVNKRKSSVFNVGGVQASISQAVSNGSFSVAKTKIRLADIATKTSSLFAIKELSILTDSLSMDDKLALPRSTAGVDTPKLLGLESIIFADETLKSDKQQQVRDSENGIHGTDLVEGAAVRYLLRKIKDGSTPKDLANNRELIANEIAQETFYTTALHEMGHTFGLRHNFMGSADNKHYAPEYYDIQKQIAQGNAVDEDLDPYASSSIMDYGRDFYSQQGGLGPYDKAAIRYTYNRSINKESDPVTLAHYKFCTDHEVDEDILCRRFDKGANVSQVTQANIDLYNHSYALWHYRRGRLTENLSKGWGSPGTLMSTLLSRVFVPTRQVMDEFLYAYIGSPEVAAPNGNSFCDKLIVQASVTAGEIANICTSAAMEKAGVDPTNLGTFKNALFDQRTGQPFKDPKTYIPNGFADLLMANVEAQNFFQSVLGSAEPGDYVAWQDQAGAPFMLHALPADGATVDDRLKSLAVDLGETPNAAYLAKAKSQMARLTVTGAGRQLESRTSVQAGWTRNESLGSFWDKYAAIRALGARDLGVQKYHSHSMALNAYFAPQTKDWAASLFGALINGAEAFSTIKMSVGGQVQNVFIPASLNADTQALSSFIAVAALTTETDGSMLTKLKICNANEAECTQAVSGQVAEYHSAQGGETFRAFQTLNGDSIAFDMITDAKAVEDQRLKIATGMADASKTQADNLMNLSNASGLRDQIVADINAVPAFDQLTKDPSDPTGKTMAKVSEILSRWVTASWIDAAATATAQPFTALELNTKANKEIQTVSGFIASQLTAMKDAGQCWVAAQAPAPEAPVAPAAPAIDPKILSISKPLTIDLNQAVAATVKPVIVNAPLPANPGPDCSNPDAGAIRLKFLELKANLATATPLIQKVAQNNVVLKIGPVQISNLTKKMQSKDTTISSLYKLTFAAAHSLQF
jgi:hypothetical protein